MDALATAGSAPRPSDAWNQLARSSRKRAASISGVLSLRRSAALLLCRRFFASVRVYAQKMKLIAKQVLLIGRNVIFDSSMVTRLLKLLPL